MAKRKVLYVTYDHPAVHPGGAQQHALELYEAMRASDEFEPMLLAYYQSGTRNTLTARGAAPFGRVTVDDPNQYFLFARRSIADALHFTSSNKDIPNHFFRDFLLAHKPDIIHFQCVLFLGHELFRAAKTTLPEAPIVHTLHEYMAICPTWTMVTTSDQLCSESSPRRCHACFPDRPAQYFAQRILY